eukprot:CAMPEP_0113602166 /NCGR_PEP_ID=MMETSP0017_2-20120614/610_1 /TAXON_ID=2856 /ORGANISM="Cylindrotheca closterium" /LENGTH=47 /DNA_ID=CAMNT_0000510493 /DNA_START=81 /DNA_END=221 /DNA_ORIENTATION=- /assembly_acc=CAM_ASM_000147
MAPPTNPAPSVRVSARVPVTPKAAPPTSLPASKTFPPIFVFSTIATP